MGSVNSPLQSLDSLETHRFDEGVVRQALISEHSVPECDFVKLSLSFRFRGHARNRARQPKPALSFRTRTTCRRRTRNTTPPGSSTKSVVTSQVGGRFRILLIGA